MLLSLSRRNAAPELFYGRGLGQLEDVVSHTAGFINQGQQ